MQRNGQDQMLTCAAGDCVAIAEGVKLYMSEGLTYLVYCTSYCLQSRTRLCPVTGAPCMWFSG